MTGLVGVFGTDFFFTDVVVLAREFLDWAEAVFFREPGFCGVVVFLAEVDFLAAVDFFEVVFFGLDAAAVLRVFLAPDLGADFVFADFPAAVFFLAGVLVDPSVAIQTSFCWLFWGSDGLRNESDIIKNPLKFVKLKIVAVCCQARKPADLAADTAGRAV